MKLTAVLLIVASLQISAKTFSQKITLSVKNTALNEVLQEIRKQSGYKLVYNTDQLKKSHPVSMSVHEASLEETLAKAMTNQPFEFEIEDKTILINPSLRKTATELTPAVQKIVITGKVADGKGPLVGATVMEKGTKNVVTTNDKGEFSIKVDQAGVMLVFSYIGFSKKELPASTTFMNVVLQGGDMGLNEVVVTGYQKIDKKTFTGSVSQVSKELVNRSGYTDVSRMLQGAAAGVSVENVSGTFGATPKIRIRGNASISANQEPLYVINGVPIASPANISVNQLYSGDPASLLGSAIAGLNASDIEDITILKDGSATALYGTRAANGVISITTKKGKKNSTVINLSTAFTVGVKPNINQYNVMNSEQQMDLSRDLFNYGYLSVLNYPSTTGAFSDPYMRYANNQISKDQFNAELNRARSVNTDWFDVLFRNNLLQEHSLSFSGGGDKSTYYLSGSYANDNGSAVGYNMKRYTTDFRVVLNLTPKLDVDFNLNASFRNQLSPGTFNGTQNNFETTRAFELNPATYAATTSRAMSPYDENGNYKYYLRSYAPFNILEEINENFNTLKSQDVRFAVRPTYRITKNLTFETLVSARKTSANYDHVMTEYSNVAAAYRVATNDKLRSLNPYLYKDPSDPNSIPETILPRGGILEARQNIGNFFYMTNTLSWKQQFNQKHNLSVFGGFELASDKVTSSFTRGYGYMYYGGKIISPSILAMKKALETDDRYYIEGFTQENRTALFISTQYSFDNKYNIELAGRVDGNNMFGRKTQTRFLPNYSIGVSWNVDKEKFFSAINSAGKIDYLKIRGSYGLRGNAYQTSPNINANYVNLNRPDAVNSEIGIRIFAPELYSLSWEKDYTANLGFEIGLFNKLNLVTEFYSRRNKDLIKSSTVGYEDGFSSKTINWASLKNEGIDITLGVKDIVATRNFKWGADFIFGYVKNTMTEGDLFSPLLTEKTKPDGYGTKGKPLYGLYAYNFAGLDANGQPLFKDKSNGNVVDNIVLSSTNDGLITYMGPRQPTTTGSLTNTFKYKSLELRVFLTYSLGNKVFRSPMVKRIYADDLAASQDIDARWRTAGDERLTNIPGLVSNIQNAYLSSAFIQNEFAYNRSDLMVVSADVLRLSEVMLSYNLGPKILQNTPWLKSARLTFSANNIHYWASSKLRGVDPQSLITGVSLPNPRSYTLRLIAQF
ncbi:SusC/RagA family TonB-linked outer membrane protein [Pedobacter nutrimenti]|nr:SusC/RagA family TonB-linked outer membrane protein [Pedobacter nutrimenti]